MAMMKAFLTFRRTLSSPPNTWNPHGGHLIASFEEVTIEVEGDKVGVSVIPSENPALITIWYSKLDGSDLRATEGVLLANLVRYKVETLAG